MITPRKAGAMQLLGESITEIFHHLLEERTGDDRKQMTEGKAEAWPVRMLASLAKPLQLFN